MFKNRSFQVKLVKDQQDSGEPFTAGNPVDNILIAQSYADLVVNTATELAKIGFLLMIAKTGCELTIVAAKAITK